MEHFEKIEEPGVSPRSPSPGEHAKAGQEEIYVHRIS